MRSGKLTLFVLAAALLLFPCGALAEVFAGETDAVYTVPVTAQASGTLTEMYLFEGQTVTEGDPAGLLAAERTFAPEDGTVVSVSRMAGENGSGAVLQILPVEKFTAYCTVSQAKKTPENMLVRPGETVYLKCTMDGSHKGVGTVVQPDGSEYRVLLSGGEFQVGETVYVYRDAACSSAKKIGIGTIAANDPVSVEADGTVTALYVEAGEYVERGELLFDTVSGTDRTLTVPVSGIVSEVDVSEGESIEKGAAAARIIPEDAVCVRFTAGEESLRGITGGIAVTVRIGEDGAAIPGTVSEISKIAGEDGYTVTVLPETAAGLRIGAAVEVITE